MKRKSIKKSSNFKVQAEKNVFKNYLQAVEDCQTVRSYPHLLQEIKQSSQTVFQYCFSYSEESPFLRGLNYNSRSYGFYVSQNIIVYREWLPSAKQAYLMGEFNQFNPKSHQLQPIEDQYGMFKIQINMNETPLNQGSKLQLRIINSGQKEYLCCPPSCFFTQKEYGIFSMNDQVPNTYPSKKPVNVLLAYTIDFNELPIKMGEKFIQQNQKTLQNFNVIILKNVFTGSSPLESRNRLSYETMKIFRDIVAKLKNQLCVKVVLEWDLGAGKRQQDCLYGEYLIEEENSHFCYDFSRKDFLAMYLARLSYYMSYFALDGFYYNNVSHLYQKQSGKVVLRCLTLLNQKLCEGGLTIASTKEDIPGLNNQILDGGLGFSFSINENVDCTILQDYDTLQKNWQKIFMLSNSIKINLDPVLENEILQMFFVVFSSKHGVIFEGDFSIVVSKLQKLLVLRKKAQLFKNCMSLQIKNENLIQIKRGKVLIWFNFEKQEKKIAFSEDLEILYGSEEKIKENGQCLVVGGESWCMLEQND